METVFLVPAAAIATFLVLGNGARSWSLRLLPFITLVIIYLIGGWTTLASALLLIAPGFVIKELLLRYPRRYGLPWSLVLIICHFALLKDYFGMGVQVFDAIGLDRWRALLASVGLSFVVFRVIEYLVSTRQAALGGGQHSVQSSRSDVVARLHAYVSFCLAYPSFSSGPILRWRGFCSDYDSNADIFPTAADMRKAVRRIANGLLKFTVISQPMLLIVRGVVDGTAQFGALDFRHLLFINCAAIFYLHFLYVNFSAFSDVMIGSARFVGLNLPENFDRPFASKNFLEFWNRWNLSISHWFRDFVFTPITKFFVVRGVRSNTLCSCVAYVVTFGLLGLWHGRTWPFLLCGTILALGALGNQLYRDAFVRRRTTRGQREESGVIATAFARGLTWFWISLAILGLWLPPAPIRDYWLSYLTWPAWPAALAAVVLYATIIALLEAFHARMRTPSTAWASVWMTSSPSASALKIVAALLAWLWLSADGAHSFVYEGF